MPPILAPRIQCGKNMIMESEILTVRTIVMKNLGNYLLLNFMLMLLASCAGKGIREQDLAQIKKVAVYSFLGDQMNHTFIGTMVFQNKDQKLSVIDWKMDDAAVNVLRKMLKANSAIVSVEVLQGKFNRVQMAPNWQKPFTDQAKAQGFDTLVAVVPASYTNAAAFTAGYGLNRHSAFGVVHTNAYLLAQVQIFNTTTGELMAWHFTYDELTGKPNIISSASVPWKDNPKDFSLEERNNLQKILKNHIASGITYALHALKLAPIEALTQ